MLFMRNNGYARERASTYKKYGAPITATTTPTGISVLDNKLRPTVSLTITSKLPIRAAVGIKRSCLGPTNLLARCGAISPTKPIPPLTDTEEPAKPTAAASSNSCSFLIGVPKPFDVCSPRLSTLSTLALYKTNGIMKSIQGNNANTNFQFVPHMLPASHVATNWYFSGSSLSVSMIIAALIP